MQSIGKFLYFAVTNRHSNAFISKFQTLCGLIPENNKVENKSAYLFFKFISAMGEEIFSLLPLVVWFYYPVSFNIFTNFLFILLGAQLAKEVYKLPRPPAEADGIKIAKLEKHFETEYGFPSTHTTTAFLPMSMMFILRHHGLFVGEFFFVGSWLHVIVTGLSRLYLGVHSPADILGGIGVGYALLRLLVASGDSVERFLYGTHAGFALTLASLPFFLWAYPRTRPWRACIGTSSTIFGVWWGGSVGAYLALHWLPSVLWALHQTSLLPPRAMWYDGCATLQALGLQSAAEAHGGSQSVRDIALKLAVGLPALAFAKFGVKVLVSAPLLALLRRGWLRRLPGEEVDCLGQPVPDAKAYCIEVPVR